MSFVSYAQNFEDVLLWRTLGHVTPGFYIDVGANDPDEHSVTKAFYDTGWSGINIEPLQAFHAHFLTKRPRDINLAVAAGAEEGEIVLFDVPAVNGWASSSPDVASMHREEGYDIIERRVPLRTLDAIWQEHVTGPVHFLKIDVEGFEEQVIRGLDLDRHRPWVLVIEATMPNSRETNYDVWEHLVTGHAYLFAYFDGLNRYYVAAEHASLLPNLQVQVNVFDDAITARLEQALNENAELLALIAAKETRGAASAATTDQFDAALRDAAERMESRFVAADAALAELWHNALPSINQELAALDRRIGQVHVDCGMQASVQAASVEQRLRDALDIFSQQVFVRLEAVENRESERVIETVYLEARLRDTLLTLDQRVTASDVREAARIEQNAALEARLLSAVAAVESQLVRTERRIEPMSLQLHEADRRLASAEEAAYQARQQIDDAALASSVSSNRADLADQRVIQLEQQIHALMTSTSWRITAPWRMVGSLARRFKSAAHDGRLVNGIQRRAQSFILGPAGPETGRLRGWMRHAARLPWARRLVIPAMQRYPAFGTAVRRLAGTTPPAAPLVDLIRPEWPGPLPAEYMMMPAATRAVLLDLARGGQLPAPKIHSTQS